MAAALFCSGRLVFQTALAADSPGRKGLERLTEGTKAGPLLRLTGSFGVSFLWAGFQPESAWSRPGRCGG